MPVSLEGFLVKVTAGLREGRSVAIVQDDAQLTTVEAARTLGVSRQFLIGQLEKGEIPFHMVGTHRRLYARDVLAYRMRRDRKRHRILNDLTRAEAEDGLYDREPPDDRAN
jgi:excisionase family DNA binding protein